MPCKNLRFLVVEDQEFQRNALVQLLRSLGAEAVHSAEDGAGALQILQDPGRTVDIVVTDLAMPGMDGMELVRHVSETGVRVSVILASALDRTLLASVGSMTTAYNVNLLGIIAKPLTAGKLSPLMELHRAGKAESGRADALFGLDEIALAWTHEEFEPWFEPQVDLATRQVRGMSVLPRWAHADKGFVEAETFMASVNARGLNDDFVWLMLRKSMAQCRKWHDQGHALRISVSLGFQSLTHADMAARVQQIAAAEGLDPGFVTLTVTEAALRIELANALENLARLRMAGFGLAIDNFGEGLMSAEQLSVVAFTELKIHPKFVSDTAGGDGHRAGLAVALELAHELRLRSVADGIDSQAQWKLLFEWGCNFGQGAYISAPLAGREVHGWLARWNDAEL